MNIYSPQLVVSQQEYILALNNLKALEQSPIEDIRRGAEELVHSSRERLRLFNNAELLLKPDMFAEVTIYASRKAR